MDRIDVKRLQVQDALAEMRKSAGEAPLLVGQVMTPAPSCISPDTSAPELVRLFHEKQFRHLLVTSRQGKLLGVISDGDVIRCFGPEGNPDREVLAAISAGQLMSADVVSTEPCTPLAQAVAMMIAQGISCLPVLADGMLLGILTHTDLHLVLQVMLDTTCTAGESSLASLAYAPQN